RSTRRNTTPVSGAAGRSVSSTRSPECSPTPVVRTTEPIVRWRIIAADRSMQWGRRSRLLHHRIGVRDLELARLLDVQRLDDAVLQQHRIPLRTHAHAGDLDVEPERTRPVGAAVGDHPDLSLGALVARPRAHHEGIVHRDAPDLVDAVALERVVLLEVSGYVLRRTGRRERTGQPEHDDTLAAHLVEHLQLARPDRAPRPFGLHVLLDGGVGDALAFFDHL